MNRNFPLFLLAPLLVACNFRPELSAQDKELYRLAINASRSMKDASYAAIALSLLRENDPTRQAEAYRSYDQDAADKYVNCLEDRREERIPFPEGVKNCDRVAPMPSFPKPSGG